MASWSRWSTSTAPREVVVTFVPEVQLGDYVIVHAGVALQRLDEAAAAETLALFAEMGDGEPV